MIHMVIVVGIVIFILTVTINYLSMVAVNKDKNVEKDKKLIRIREILKQGQNRIKTDNRWFLRKGFLLSLLFATISTVGACFVMLFINNWIAIIRYLIIIVLLSPVAIIDCYTRKIYNNITLCAIIIRVLIFIPEFFVNGDSFKNIIIVSFLGLLVGFILLAILSFISRGGLGMGDVKIISVLGFYTGLATMFYTLVLGMFCCFFYCIYLIIVKKKDKEYEIPFGPFILIGLVLSMIIG